MSAKVNPSLKPRFTSSKSGRAKLLSALCSQTAISGNMKLAERIAKSGTLIEVKANKTIIEQGGADNDVFFIISGSAGIIINKREVSVRGAGTHVGEMALLDTTARRSATVVTRENSLFLKLSEPAATRIASDHPDFWRKLALELAVRLRERGKFIREPNAVSQVFIGSSSEALNEATSLNDSLNRKGVTCSLWTQDVFQPSQTTIEDLLSFADSSDFAILLMTADDMTVSRGRRKKTPRDNVVFELGLFMGAIGRNRTFIVSPRKIDLKLPTDLLGVTHLSYEADGPKTVGRRMASVAKEVYKQISKRGPK
jgi:CRP/FNR family cyclic AMP-dependent transcriptional regulator